MIHLRPITNFGRNGISKGRKCDHFGRSVVPCEEAEAGPSGLQMRSYSWHFVKNFHALAMKLKDVGGIWPYVSTFWKWIMWCWIKKQGCYIKGSMRKQQLDHQGFRQGSKHKWRVDFWAGDYILSDAQPFGEWNCGVGYSSRLPRPSWLIKASNANTVVRASRWQKTGTIAFITTREWHG